MGEVYRARDPRIGRDVAIKVLPAFAAGDETSVRRFINEIRLARRISHRNVVRTHDVGRWSGGLFLSMEFVAGRTLPTHACLGSWRHLWSHDTPPGPL